MIKEEVDKLLENAILIIDSREQKVKHITEKLELQGIPYRVATLSYGDYALEIDGIIYDFVQVIERKANLNELSNNITKGRDRFERELTRGKGAITLMVEESTLKDLIGGNYRSKITPKSFMATLSTYKARYNLDYIFTRKQESAWYIWHTLKYAVREYLLSIEEEQITEEKILVGD